MAFACNGSACGPVIVPVFKTGGWQAILSPMGSTPIRFRHLPFNDLRDFALFGSKFDRTISGARCDENVIVACGHFAASATELAGAGSCEHRELYRGLLLTLGCSRLGAGRIRVAQSCLHALEDAPRSGQWLDIGSRVTQMLHGDRKYDSSTRSSSEQYARQSCNH